MKLKVLASGSTGNCYLLENKEEILMIECGISFKRIQKGVNFNINKVVGCLISHEHGDHSKSLESIKKSAIPTYSSQGTFKALGQEEDYRLNKIKRLEQFKVGGFTILPFDTQHDAEEPLGFLIEHKDMGKLLFITDSYYCKYNFKEVDHVLVEANYKEEYLMDNLRKGKIPRFLYKRVRESHFEISDVVKFLKASDLSKTKNIVLLHLSGNNSNPKEFKSIIEREFGISTEIARGGLEIEMGDI